MLPDRPTPPPALPAAVSTLVHDVVHGPLVAARVLAVHRYALYLRVGGTVVPVVTADAVALPTAVRLALPSAAFPLGWGVAAGDHVLVGDGRLVLPHLDVVAARAWRPARVRRATLRVGCPAGRPDSHLSTQLGGDRQGVHQGWLVDGIRAAVLGRAGVEALVGRGAGLTPSGDDALAGALLVTHALGAGTALADAVRALLGATTTVSAALLEAAADGYAARPVVTLVDAAVAGDPDAVARALPAVLAIGHTSGADTVTGMHAALDALAAPLRSAA